jgi:hypothetical protein
VRSGWTPIADVFLANYAHLDPPITTGEAMFIIQLLRYKWDASPPFPSFGVIARAMDITDTAARGHARRLEAKKYLRRLSRVGQANLFDLQPLFAALENLAARDGEAG